MNESSRASRSEPEPVLSGPASGGDSQRPADREPVDLSRLPAEHRGALRRLWKRVEEAADTIDRLRAENERLRERVQELESRPAFPEAETVLALNDDPEALKDRVTQFIEAIDTYLNATAPDPVETEKVETVEA